MPVYAVTYVFTNGTVLIARVEGEYEDVVEHVQFLLSHKMFLAGSFVVNVRYVNHARVERAS